MNAMEEKHLTIETLIDGVRIDVQEINDPFLHNRTTHELSLWDRIKLLWFGRVLFEVKIRGDSEAHRQWFKTDEIPRGGRGTEETAQAVQGAADGVRRASTDGADH